VTDGDPGLDLELVPGGDPAGDPGQVAGPAAGDDPGFQLGGVAVMPGYAWGGRVERTGIALVHEGEYVVPAPGSEAVISPAAGPAGTPVVWSFPVEVEVVGELSEEHLRAVATHVFDELDTALRRIG
jgi:hypothetical protein